MDFGAGVPELHSTLSSRVGLTSPISQGNKRLNFKLSDCYYVNYESPRGFKVGYWRTKWRNATGVELFWGFGHGARGLVKEFGSPEGLVGRV